MSPAKRVIGRYRGREAGPTVLCVAGMHGNEPAGVTALGRVFEALQSRRPPCRGELVGIAGNLRALAAGRRYLERDLNRQWRPEVLAGVGGGPAAVTAGAETAELQELRDAIHTSIAAKRGPTYFLDLHTTSSRTAPFAVINDTIPNRAFARSFRVPIILGLEEHVTGALADYAHSLGCITMGFEGGQHDDPRSVDLLEAAVWVALEATRFVAPQPGAQRGRWARRLAAAARGLPRYLEILDRYPVDRARRFTMLPGFENFQPVAAGQLVARDDHAPIRAWESARLFMPRYQQTGDDGFFLARAVKAHWLEVSTLLRGLRLDKVIHWLPGVRRHPAVHKTVVVNPRIARWYTLEVFHLLGYRRRPPENGRFVFSRREPDPWPRPQPHGGGPADR